MTSFKFSFNLSPPTPPNNGDIEAPNEVEQQDNNSPSSITIENSDNKPIATKPIEILNASKLLPLFRRKTHANDWNYDEVHLSQQNLSDDHPDRFYNIDPLRRLKLSDPKSYNSSRDKHSTAESANEIATIRNAIVDEKELIEDQKTDIIPGVYEGGLKVWECSVDLCIHLAQELSRLDREEDAERNMNHLDGSDLPDNDIRRALSKGGSTWELGCGHGLPGCLILRELVKRRRERSWHHSCNNNEGYGSHSDGKEENNDAIARSNSSMVLFSDYNDFVLRDVTLPSIVLNTLQLSNCSESATTKTLDEDEDLDVSLSTLACLAAGDWLNLSDRLLSLNEESSHDTVYEEEQTLKSPIDGRFDLILGAEVTYSVSSTKDTVLLLLRHLKVNTGIGLVATKRYYFGVGGGMDLFREIASREVICINDITYGLSVEKVKSYDCGKANIRDLLRIRCIQRHT